jgi:SAM-dependent methyltransferase
VTGGDASSGADDDVRKFRFFANDTDTQLGIESMRPYTRQRPELDQRLLEVLPDAGFDLSERLKVLDVACGIGHLTLTLAEALPNADLLGVDHDPLLVEEAKRLAGDHPRVGFDVGDIYELGELGTHDIVVNWKTLSWLPTYELALEALLGATGRHLFLSSLFYEGDIDFEIKVRQHAKARKGGTGFQYYNVYSLPRFEEVARSLGARVTNYDFEIGIDLDPPDRDVMGTYTVRTDAGRRLQISGAVVMSWKILRLDV